MKEQVVWGIHAGRTGDADSLFLKNSVVAIGWHEMGDLSKITCNRETYKTRVTNVFPNANRVPFLVWRGNCSGLW